MDKYLTKDKVKTILLNAPEGADKNKIVEALVTKGYTLEGLNDKVQKPVEEPNYLQRVVGQYKEAGEDIKSEVAKAATPTESTGGDIKQLGQTVLRGVGDIAGAAFAPIVEAPVIKQALDYVGEKIGNTEVGNKISEYIQKNPEQAKNIEAIVNIATLGGGKIAEAPIKEATGEILQKAGTSIEKSGLKSLQKEKEVFIRDLVRPEQTKAVKEAQVGRTTEKGSGIFKKSIINPTPAEVKIEKAVSSIPEVSSKNTFQQNYNIIKEANIQEAKNLEKLISDNNFIIPKKEVKARLLQAQENLSQSPLITGDAEKMAEKLIIKANQLVDKYSGTGSGLLTARKEYDMWVTSQKPKAFDATAENAFTLANREVRNTFNSLLEEKAPKKGIKDSLSKQSSLYSAMDNIKPKAALEADTAIGRAFNNMAQAVGIKNKVVQQIATIAGIGGLGAAATFAPAVAVGGGLTFLGYKGAKLVMKPELRIAIGKLLKQSGHLLNPEDKAILQNAIITFKETPNKQGGFIKISKNDSVLTPEMKDNIVKIIDDYELKGGKNIELQADASTMLEDLGQTVPKKYGDAVKKLRDILEKSDQSELKGL